MPSDSLRTQPCRFYESFERQNWIVNEGINYLPVQNCQGTKGSTFGESVPGGRFF